MSGSVNKDTTKKRGRPPTGRDPVTAIRLSPELRAQIDAWAQTQSDRPSRSEAIRRILQQTLGEKRSRSKLRLGLVSPVLTSAIQPSGFIAIVSLKGK